jgi:hypothetical protein
LESASDTKVVTENKEVTLHSNVHPHESNQIGRGAVKDSLEEAFNNPVMCQTEVLPKTPKGPPKNKKPAVLSKLRIE